MRIAQITDLHLRHFMPGCAPATKRLSRHMSTLFKRALDQIVREGAELIAVTGDLLDVPDFLHRGSIPEYPPDEPQQWYEDAIGDYQLIQQMLDDTGLPYALLPGNHDWERAFFRVFPREPHWADLGDIRLVRFVDREWQCNVPRRFDPMRRLWEEMLADEASPPQVHLQHYVITPMLNEGYPHTYAESEQLTRKIVESGRVRLSLSGHYHKGTDLIRQGDTYFTTCPAFCTPPFPWRMYDVDGDAVRMTQGELGIDAIAKRKAVFLDRDGVLNTVASFRAGAEALQLVEGAGDAVRRLNQAGLAVIVISSQNAIGRGYYPKPVVNMTNDRLARLLAREGAALDGIYFSQSDPTDPALPEYADHSQAKPSPHHIHQAAAEHHLDLTGAFFVGDRATDIQCALNAQITPILVQTGFGADQLDKAKALKDDLLVLPDLPAAVDHILS